MLNRLAVYAPKKGEMLTIRGAVEGQTALWAFRMSQEGLWLPKLQWGMQLTGVIQGADFNPAIDERIANQRQSIESLLEHLKIHCPKLTGTGECGHIGKEV